MLFELIIMHHTPNHFAFTLIFFVWFLAGTRREKLHTAVDNRGRHIHCLGIEISTVEIRANFEMVHQINEQAMPRHSAI